MAYKNIHSTQRKFSAFMSNSSLFHRCERGSSMGSFLRECFRQCSRANYSGRPCEKLQVKLASQASWCHFHWKQLPSMGDKCIEWMPLGVCSQTGNLTKLPHFHNSTSCEWRFFSSTLSYTHPTALNSQCWLSPSMYRQRRSLSKA